MTRSSTPPKPARRLAKDKVDDLATMSTAPDESPRTLESALGLQIRLLRRELDLSVGDLSNAAGISIGMLSKIENGQISPSLTTVNAIANALNVPLTTLFTAFEDKRDCSFVSAGQGVIIERRGSKAGHVYELLGHALGGAAGGDVVVEPYLITLEKDASPYTNFRHAGTEFIYMLSGEVVYRHADRTYNLRPGDALLFDSGGVHGPETLVSLPMTYLSIIVYARKAG